MPCPKCGWTNPTGAVFCVKCHATLIFKCPKCWNEQNHGGKCDKCGADFAQLQGVYLAQVMGEEFRETQNEVNSVNPAAEAISNPVPRAFFLLLRWIYTRFFA